MIPTVLLSALLLAGSRASEDALPKIESQGFSSHIKIHPEAFMEVTGPQDFSSDIKPHPEAFMDIMAEPYRRTHHGHAARNPGMMDRDSDGIPDMFDSDRGTGMHNMGMGMGMNPGMMDRDGDGIPDFMDSDRGTGMHNMGMGFAG